MISLMSPKRILESLISDADENHSHSFSLSPSTSSSSYSSEMNTHTNYFRESNKRMRTTSFFDNGSHLNNENREHQSTPQSLLSNTSINENNSYILSNYQHESYRLSSPLKKKFSETQNNNNRSDDDREIVFYHEKRKFDSSSPLNEHNNNKNSDRSPKRTPLMKERIENADVNTPTPLSSGQIDFMRYTNRNCDTDENLNKSLIIYQGKEDFTKKKLKLNETACQSLRVQDPIDIISTNHHQLKNLSFLQPLTIPSNIFLTSVMSEDQLKYYPSLLETGVTNPKSTSNLSILDNVRDRSVDKDEDQNCGDHSNMNFWKNAEAMEEDDCEDMKSNEQFTENENLLPNRKNQLVIYEQQPYPYPSLYCLPDRHVSFYDS